MSGIYGLSSKQGDKRLRECLEALEENSRIYGDAGNDSFISDGMAMGCRLEHFSEEYPASPPVLRQGKWAAVIDALLFNREELLPLVGMDNSAGDEELLFRLIQKKGTAALKLVNGDFAGAMYDKEEKTWLLFRDHMGVRPLYVYMKGGEIAFATDIRGLLRMPGMDATVNERQLYLRMMGGNDNSATQTAFANISMVDAGRCLWLKETRDGYSRREEAYFVPGSERIRLGRRENYEKCMYELVEDAVSRRLKAVPGKVGAELSGGLDSAVIDVLIHRMGREAVYFSWSPPVEEHPLQEEDERLLIDSICRQEGIRCDFLPRKKDSMMSLFQRDDPPHVHTIQVGRTAAWMRSQGVRTVFSGHGGDEGASHRMGEIEMWHQREYLAYAREIFWQMKGSGMPLARTALHILRRIRRGKDYVKPFVYKKQTNEGLLNPAFAERWKQTSLPALTFGYATDEYVRQGGQRLRLENAAFQAAEHGVRYLFPLMDHRVMQFSLGIPRRMFLHRGVDRHIFRRAFARLLPRDVLNQTRKDSPGIANQPSEGRMEDYRRSVDELLNRLDRAVWGKYWNMAEVEKIRGIAGTAQCPLDSRSINELFICWIIQRWQEEAKHG